MLNETTRRVTTGFNEKKQSAILADEQVQTFTPYDTLPSFHLQELFYTEDVHQALTTRHLQKPYDINLPKGAFRFLKVRMPTKSEMIDDLKKAGQPIPTDWTTHNLHSTDSIDYVYILSGKITCIVDGKQLHFSAGDFLVQVGPEHTWINDHDEPCYALCIMIGLEPSGAIKKLSVD